ncbi:MAG TPA: hypothetical protein VFS21_04200 [Roseiflexaceae bacterium]|nr:hypothetical protein [Roseiflexaceae bacterium]
MSHDRSLNKEAAPPPALVATCALCGQQLAPERDDLYAELCSRCEGRSLKGRQQRERRPAPRAQRFSKSGGG